MSVRSSGWLPSRRRGGLYSRATAEWLSEKRAVSRQRVFKAGTIIVGDSTHPCTVRDVSAKGARLSVPATGEVPDRFQLVFSTCALAMTCDVVWRSGDKLGVVFPRIEPRPRIDNGCE